MTIFELVLTISALLMIMPLDFVMNYAGFGCHLQTYQVTIPKQGYSSRTQPYSAVSETYITK